LKTTWGRVSVYLAAIALCLIAVLLMLGQPLGDSAGQLFQGAFGSTRGLARTFVKATPLILCGLGVLVAWRGGAFNIGGDGQFLIGGVLAGVVFKFVPLPPGPIGNTTLLIAAVLGGAGYAYIASWLHAKRGVQIVVSTILLNYIAIQILSWVVTGPLKDPKSGLPMSDRIPEGFMLMKFSTQHDLHAGVFIPPIVAVLLWFFLHRTLAGFQLRLAGNAPGVARVNRVDVDKVKTRAMLMSGGLCGLAAGIELTALSGQLSRSFSQDWGLLGIPVALLGGLNPLGVLASGIGVGALFAGTDELSRFRPGGGALVFVIQAVVVLAVLALGYWKDRTAKTEVSEDV
jgi:simple sugar transport system permease protein